MESDFMSITEKIKQRRLEVEKALTEEMQAIDQALPQLRQYLTEKIESELNSFKIDLERQEKEHYQVLLLHMRAIEEEIGIKVKITRGKDGKLKREVYDLKESLIDKMKVWEK